MTRLDSVQLHSTFDLNRATKTGKAASRQFLTGLGGTDSVTYCLVEREKGNLTYENSHPWAGLRSSTRIALECWIRALHWRCFARRWTMPPGIATTIALR